MNQKPVVIEKEEVEKLSFPKEEVLTDSEAIKKRARDLEDALKLGNLERLKIKIIFEDTTGIKQVETTVWGVTVERIILKQGIVIPIKRVHQVII